MSDIQKCSKGDSGCQGRLANGVRPDGKARGLCDSCLVKHRGPHRTDNFRRLKPSVLVEQGFSPLPDSKDLRAWASWSQEAQDWYRANAKASVQAEPRLRLSNEDRAWLDSIDRRPIRQMDGESVPSKKPEPKATPGVEKSKAELTRMARVEFDGRCCLCGHKFGGYIYDGRDYVRLGLEHCHVTKSRKEGGLAEDDFPGCTVCQRLQGKLPGMPLEQAQMKVRQIHELRGYEFYTTVTGVK
jgi:hypothetical protein